MRPARVVAKPLLEAVERQRALRLHGLGKAVTRGTAESERSGELDEGDVDTHERDGDNPRLHLAVDADLVDAPSGNISG